MATYPPPGGYAPGGVSYGIPDRKYFTYKPGTKGSKLKIPKGMHAAFKEGKGWFAAPGLAVAVKRPTTSQARTTIESPAQIEQRVTRMAQAAYDRQKSDLEAEAEQMRVEAEGRRLGMIAAYKAAGEQNAAMGAQVQQGWQNAAGSMAGIAGITTGGIADALSADLASQEAALSRIGASGTGFDARSQAAAEAYRGGVLPAEFMAREGAVGNEYILRSAENLKAQGMQTAYSAEAQATAERNAERLKAIRELGEGRITYEDALRKQLLDARDTQLDAVAKANDAVLDAKMAIAKLNQQYTIAKMNARTKLELKQIDQIYKDQKLALDQQMSQSLIDQRNASAQSSLASAGLANVKAAAGGFAPKTPPGTTPPSPTTISNNMVRATKAGNNAIQTVFDNLWAKTPGSTAPANWDKKKNGDYANSAQYAAAVARTKKMRTKAFGTIMSKVVKALTPHLKSLRYTPAQIRREAFNIVSQRVDPGPAYKKYHPEFF